MSKIRKAAKPASAKSAPAKPYPDSPLFWHQAGTWAKKIRGKTFYFGADADAALKKYTEERDDLHAGRTPRARGNGVTVRDLCNRFLTAKKLLRDSAEIGNRTFGEYHESCEVVMDQFGKNRLVSDLAGEDFDKLRALLAKTNGPVSLGNRIQRVRTLFKFGWEDGLLEKPIRFGATFKKPSRKVMRKARNASGARMFEPAEVNALFNAAGAQLKAMILLGVNCGFGQSDVTALPRSAIDLAGGWIDYPRPKTGIPRRCPLWPETVKALRVAIAKRPAPKDSADADLAFMTKYGHRWQRVYDSPKTPGKVVIVDSVGLEFKKVLTECELVQAGRSFYSLRHTFRTVADSSKDAPAIDHIMGHAREDVASVHYRERIDDSRLRAVSEVVRVWLWPQADNREPKP